MRYALSCDVMWCTVMWCDTMGWDGMLCGCDAMWLCDVVGCEVMWCDAMQFCDVVKWQMMCCELGRAHSSKTHEMPIPMRSETLWCKRQQDYGEPKSQYYDSAVQSITQYYHVLQRTTRTTTYKVLHATTTYYHVLQNTTTYYSVQLRNVTIRHSRLIVVSRNTWNVQYIARSKL